MVKALWGRSRAMRCLEVVVSIITDPCTTDPYFAALTKVILDAVRLFKKDPRLAGKMVEVLAGEPRRQTRNCGGFPGQLVEACEEMGLQLEGNLSIQGQGRRPMHLVGPSAPPQKVLIRRLRDAATFICFSSLR